MKTKAIVAGAVVLVVLFFLAILLVVSPKPPQDITVRHVKSVQSGDVTTMTFEITNRTADTYLFFPGEVQVRNGKAWTKFQGFDRAMYGPFTTVDPAGLVCYTVNVTNLPAKSVVRFSIRPMKKLLGLSSLFLRARINLQHRGTPISLNPYDRKSSVYGKATEVTSAEFVEPVE